ncbi:hypothetical protein E2C01_083150 [Portunus trituberculatus]|uniref:Uncharacterized protein n=1 Tax=Portunus trituberculatus TaxID=210409 RepID=A0A5B7J0Z6_PORTR|nr:hypothetical protein [Portunus trituberculatus]
MFIPTCNCLPSDFFCGRRSEHYNTEPWLCSGMSIAMLSEQLSGVFRSTSCVQQRPLTRPFSVVVGCCSALFRTGTICKGHRDESCSEECFVLKILFSRQLFPLLLL